MRDFFSIMGVTALALGFVFIGGMFGVQYAQFSAEAAAIEQLRADAACIDLTISQDVMGQVAKVNQEIVGWQAYRKMWFSGLINSGWDNVKLIPVPEKPKNPERPPLNHLT
jgi:hypothetical protein